MERSDSFIMRVYISVMSLIGTVYVRRMVFNISKDGLRLHWKRGPFGRNCAAYTNDT